MSFHRCCQRNATGSGGFCSLLLPLNALNLPMLVLPCMSLFASWDSVSSRFRASFPPMNNDCGITARRESTQTLLKYYYLMAALKPEQSINHALATLVGFCTHQHLCVCMILVWFCLVTSMHYYTCHFIVGWACWTLCLHKLHNSVYNVFPCCYAWFITTSFILYWW